MDKKFKIFVVVAIIVLTLVISFVTYLFLSQSAAGTADNQDKIEKQVEEPKIVEVPISDEIMTNIALGEDRVPHFAKVKISLGINEKDEKAYKALSEIIATKSASIRNELIEIVGVQTYDMLSATDGKVKLADEIVSRLNKLLGTDLICEVYYQDYFVQ